MNNLKAKLVIISKEKDNLTEKFLQKILTELEIPIQSINWTELPKTKFQKQLIDEIIYTVKPAVVLSMGKKPTALLLSLPKNFKLIDYIQRVFTQQFTGEWPLAHRCYIIPIWDAHYISNRGQLELNQFKRCFKTIRQILFGEQNESMVTQNSN